MDNLIPIFPLNIVVFPHSKIPLHIFEEKYKKMIGKCFIDKKGFGIASIIRKKLSKIGSYVELIKIIKRYENGEMDIIVKGKRKFKIIKTQQHPDGYLIGEIEEYSDISNEFDKNLLEELKHNFISILSKVNFKLENAFWENYKSSELKSYRIAEKSGLSLEQQQKFLVIRKENERIDFLIKHLEKLEKKLSDSLVAGKIIMGDGYL
jgi:Lon protease-like protein